MQIIIGGVGFFDSAKTPMSIKPEEGEIEDIASMKGRPDTDVYNLFPPKMTEDEFNAIMERTMEEKK